MYESYAWPGACCKKEDKNLIIKWAKELFEGIIKGIEQAEKKA